MTTLSDLQAEDSGLPTTVDNGSVDMPTTQRLGETTSLTQNTPLPIEQVADETQQSSLPEKFTGKTAEQIADSYLELERQFGRNTSELADTRRKLEETLLTSLASAPAAKPEETTPDFAYEPEAAVRDVVAKETAGLKEELANYKAAEALKAFKAKHPNYASARTEAGFEDFVLANPYRIQMYKDAQDGGNLNRADELLTSWKEYQEIKGLKTVDQATTERNQGVENFTGVTTGGSAPAGDGAPKKTYLSRAKIIALKVQNPREYQANLAEIESAYAEGRVR